MGLLGCAGPVSMGVETHSIVSESLPRKVSGVEGSDGVRIHRNLEG